MCSNDLEYHIEAEDTGVDQEIPQASEIGHVSSENLIRKSENADSNRRGWYEQVSSYLLNCKIIYSKKNSGEN